MARNYKNILNSPFARNLALAGLSGLLLGLAYPGWPASWRIDFGFLAWVGFAPLFWLIFSAAREEGQAKYGQSFLFGYLAGLVYFLIVFRWFLSIYPLDTLGIKSVFASLALTGIVYFTSSFGMALLWGLFGLILVWQLRFIKNRSGNAVLFKVASWLIPPALFVLLEYAGSYGFGLIWLGSGTLFGPHWTFGNLAYSLWHNSFALWLSSYAGIYGVSFLIILVNVLISKILKSALKDPGDTKPAKIFAKVAVIILIVISLTIIAPKLSGIGKVKETGQKEIAFAVIQTSQPTKMLAAPKETLDGFKQQLDLLIRAAKEYPASRLIVFPEATDFFKNMSLVLSSVQVKNFFSKLFSDSRLLVSGSRIVDAKNNAYSRTFYLDTRNDIVGFYDKQLLTPGGEFIPYLLKPLILLQSKNTISRFKNSKEFSVGKTGYVKTNFRGQFSVASLVCSEILSPGLARSAADKSDVLLAMASYGVFHGSSVVAKQSMASAAFRAAENRRPLLAASNLGLSYAINARGNVEFSAQNKDAQILTGGIVPSRERSWYNKVGDMPIILASLLLLIVSVLLARLRRANNGQI